MSLFETSLESRIHSQAIAAARAATAETVAELPGIFKQSSHGANKVRPPNQREQFLAAIKRDPIYVNHSSQEREQLWQDYKNIAEQERIVGTRGVLGIQGPTIDLNTCSLDHLERVPKLTLPLRQAIMLKRNSLPSQRFSNWEDLRSFPGFGNETLRSLKVFCLDPAQGLATTAADKHPVLMTDTLDTLPSHDRHMMAADVGQLLTLWTQTNQHKPGKM